MKKKTADSEREWHALRAEFAARRKLFKSAYHLCSTGGLSEAEAEASSTEASSSEASSEGGISSESGFATDNQTEAEEEAESVEAASEKKVHYDECFKKKLRDGPPFFRSIRIP